MAIRAIFTSTGWQEGVRDGRSFNSRSHLTRVYLKRDGRWQLVQQSSALPVVTTSAYIACSSSILSGFAERIRSLGDQPIWLIPIGVGERLFFGASCVDAGIGTKKMLPLAVRGPVLFARWRDWPLFGLR